MKTGSFLVRLLAGVPVVASDVGACREVLESGKWGRLVPQGDAQAIAAHFAQFIERSSSRFLRERFHFGSIARRRRKYNGRSPFTEQAQARFVARKRRRQLYACSLTG